MQRIDTLHEDRTNDCCTFYLQMCSHIRHAYRHKNACKVFDFLCVGRCVSFVSFVRFVLDAALSGLVSVSCRANTNVYDNSFSSIVFEVQTERWIIITYSNVWRICGVHSTSAVIHNRSEFITSAVILIRKIPKQWLTDAMSAHSPKTCFSFCFIWFFPWSGIFEPWKFRLPPAMQISAAINNKYSAGAQPTKSTKNKMND